MPAITTCSICGFNGNHGFTPRVAGIMYFYHNNGSSQGCGFYAYRDKEYKTLEQAWKVAREFYPNDSWRKAYDAEIIEKKPRKAQRLFKQWHKESLGD